ncbi:MAG: hypothetical protein ACIAXF_03645, partial [Phycisphaerales bacterium JB063]
MLLVLVILGVLAGGVVVSLAGRRQTYELETAAKDIATALEYAQLNARLNNKPYRIVFGDRGNSILIETRNLADASSWNPAQGIPGREYRLPGAAHVASIGHAE